VSQGVVLRRLGAADAAAYRAVRLAGLADRPASFGSSVEEEQELPLSVFEARVTAPAPAMVLGAFDGPDLAGVARFTVEAGVKKRHIGWMTGVAVLAAHRRRGIASMLVDGVVLHARGHVLVLRTSVEAGNHEARRIYARRGFRSYGLAPRDMMIDGHFFDEDMLTLDLDRPASA
jgi:ribosomal protein S18 acetylase RimI-like enzyme